MKNIMKLFVLVAAAAMALASCQTQEMEDPTPTPKEYEYIFNIGNADEEDAPETSATLGETCVEWESGDQLGSFTNTNNGYSNVTVSDGKASFSVYSNGGLEKGQALYFYYPRVVGSDMTADAVSMSIPVSQDGDDDMPLASLPYIVTEASGTDHTIYAGKVKFANLGSVIEFHVYSTTAAYQSEKITSVTFNADQAIAGDFVFDLTAVDYSDEKTLAISDYEATSVVSTLSAPVAVPAIKEDAKVVKMVVAPGSYTGKVVVTTDKATYTYPISTAKEFKRSGVKPLGLDLRENVRQADVWSLVTSVDNMPDGEYVILAKRNGDEGYGYLPSATSTSTTPVYKTQSAFDCVSSVVAEPAVTSDMIWDFARNEGGWTITNADGKYLYSNDSTTGLRVGTTSETWSISVNSPAFSMREESRFIGAYKDKEEWRTYTTANHDNYGTAGGKLYFYYHGKLEAIPAISVSDVMGVSARGVEGAALTFVVVNPDGSEVVVACDGEIVTASEVVDGTIHYTVPANTGDATREGSITITYGDVVKTIKVSQNAPEFKSSVTNQEILLKADKAADKSFTVTSDFDWTVTLSEGAGFTVSPSGYVWEDDSDEEKGKQSVIVTASSANESPDGIVVLGTVTFTSKTGQEFIVTVKQESSYVDTSVSTATLTFDDKSKRTSFSTTKQVWEENGITFTNDKASASSNVADYANPVRCYANSSITVEMAATMSVIEFTCGSSSYATALKSSIGNDATSNGSVVTVNLATPSTSFNVAKLTAQVQLKSITVTYTDGTSGGETPEPEPEPEQPTLSPRNLEFSAATATATMGQAFSAPTLTGDKIDDVQYSSSNTAVATVNASTGAVTLVGAGTTEITASAPATAEYEAGKATYTLTVNPAQGVQQTITTYTFNSKSWGDSTKSWTSGKDGAQYTSGQGVQVTSALTGANATCKTTLSNVSSVEVSYCTNKSSGKGSITIAIGSVTKTVDVAKSGSDGRTLKTLTLDFSSELPSGTPKITVACSANSVYINALTFTHTN